MNKKTLCVVLLLPILLIGQTEKKADVWQPLRFLEGSWEGQGDGMSGVSKVVQEYRFILNKKYIQMKTKSVFKPQEKNPNGEVHEDMGMFSYDQFRKKFILRGFYVEGFVNQYVLDSISSDEKTFIFVTELIENAPPGTKAKLIFKIHTDEEMEQSFHVAFPGKEFSCYSVNKLRRTNPEV